jgi:hypothetical protein
VVAAFLPVLHGVAPWIFFLTLVAMTGAVGAFALFVVVQQFRNPARRS